MWTRRRPNNVLAFADDEHLIGHRHTEWIGVAPFLEEDLAFASIGQDELGHGIALYDLLRRRRRRPSALPPHARSGGRLVELPCRLGHAPARHWLYDRAERHRGEARRGHAVVPELGGIAERALREEEYHRRTPTTSSTGRPCSVVARPENSRARMIQSLERVLPYGGRVRTADVRARGPGRRRGRPPLGRHGLGLGGPRCRRGRPRRRPRLALPVAGQDRPHRPVPRLRRPPRRPHRRLASTPTPSGSPTHPPTPTPFFGGCPAHRCDNHPTFGEGVRPVRVLRVPRPGLRGPSSSSRPSWCRCRGRRR